MRNLVWTAVFAVVMGIIALTAAILGHSVEVVLGFGFLGVILATLAQKS